MSDEGEDEDIGLSVWKNAMARDPFHNCNIAMPCQYLISGFITGTSSGLLYGILMGTMAVNANVYGTTQTAITAPWALKCVIGFLSDQFPLMGYKRRYYCIIGNSLVAFVCTSLALFYTEPVPYFCDRLTKTICNLRAAENVHVIVITFMAIAVGTMVADSACDGLMLEIAKAQTTSARRASVPVKCFALRIAGAMVAYVMLAFGFNGESHLGFFSFELQLSLIFMLTGVLAAMSSIGWAFFANYDIRVIDRVRCSDCVPVEFAWHGNVHLSRCKIASKNLSGLFGLFSTVTSFRFLLYNLLAPALVHLSSPAIDMMATYWSGVQQMQRQLTSLLTAVISIALLGVVIKWFESFNWRILIGVATTATVFLNLPITIFAARGICRNQYVFLVQEILKPLPAASMYLVATRATVELAPDGQEATLYGIVSTAHILAVPLAQSTANWFYGGLPDWIGYFSHGALSLKQNYTADSDEFRQLVCFSILISSGTTLASQLLLGLIPKDEAGATKATRRTPRRTAFGVAITLIFLLCFTSGTTLNLITILPAMRCTTLVGGSGC